jgi:antitoxin component of RelBE/YafQ-DinJ toxin-antitoxin module
MFQARLDPAIKARAKRGAKARGVSLSRYVEMLIEADDLADTVDDDQLAERGTQQTLAIGA